MAEAGERCLLASSVFVDPSALERTMAALLAANVRLEQLCLVALPERAASIGNALASHRLEWRGVETCLIAEPASTAPREIMVTSPDLLQTLAEIHAVGLPNGQLQGRFDCRSELLAPLGSGDVALIVRSHTTAGLVATLDILLRNSSCRVQSYDFSTSPIQRH